MTPPSTGESLPRSPLAEAEPRDGAFGAEDAGQDQPFGITIDAAPAAAYRGDTSRMLADVRDWLQANFPASLKGKGGLAIAARAFGREDFTASATRALNFIRSTMWRNGRLLATYKVGRAHLNAYLDDYAYLADAILELQQLRFDAAEIAFAKDLLEVLLKHFEDREAGGFFFTSDNHEVLMHRSKSLSDDATPSGNGSSSTRAASTYW